MPSLPRIDEIVAMIRVKAQFSDLMGTLNLKEDQQDLKFCYEVLQDVSRSFAAVIMTLHPELRNTVAMFYLVLRALDTVEDDMSVSLARKKEILPTFHKKMLDPTPAVRVFGIASPNKREVELLEKFDACTRECLRLKPEYQVVISDICERMAAGMLELLEPDVEVLHTEDYERYCHYVAGLVGHGLTRLFAASGLEDPSIAKDLTLANSMGLFLQKVNITRDYFEDIVQEPPRMWWPKDIWGMFAPRLEDLKKPGMENRARECLNAMVASALKHVPDCLGYMATLKERSVFTFCAIPQVMAIATLVEIYNNLDVYHVKVKMGKGATCKIIVNSTDMRALLQQFESYLNQLNEKLVESDPSYDTTRVLMKRAFDSIKEHNARIGCDSESPSYARRFLVQYPALGGRMLYKVVDGFRAFLQPAQA